MAPARPLGLDALRRDAVARTLVVMPSLPAALERLSFVQADPIRAPARAQDLTLRHRVSGYRAGDLEAQYPALDVEEDFFINYGFLSRRIQTLLHPRRGKAPWSVAHGRRVKAILAFVAARGTVHPRDVDRHFAHGPVTNYWGGSSSLSTHLLMQMHYQGLLRVAARDRGIRLYAVRPPQPAAHDARSRHAAIDTLVDVIVAKYAPLPGPSLAGLVGRLRWGVPHWSAHIRPALLRAKARLAHARVDGVDWYWPAGESLRPEEAPDEARLLAPFDPLVWDRRRFEILWGWGYRFEAYTPVAKRQFGYYALPLLWRDRVIGWANTSGAEATLTVTPGYVAGRPPRDRGFARALDREIERLRAFLVPRDHLGT